MAYSRHDAASLCWLFTNLTVGCYQAGIAGNNFPLLAFGPVLLGWQPTPLEFADATTEPPIGILQFVFPPEESGSTAVFACMLLSNQSIRCAVTDMDYRALVDMAPPDSYAVDDGSQKVVQMCAGNAHVCVLYWNGVIRCWGSAEGCLGGACWAPPSVLFSAIDCGKSFTCGVRTDGGVSCWGSPLTTSALRPPSGVYSQLVISQQVPCAVSAIDASVHCWGAVSKAYSGQTLVLPTMSVKEPSWLCALRRRHNPALTPSIACWSEDGAAAGVMYLPPRLAHTAFHSIAVTSFYICVQFEDDLTVECFGDNSNPEASLFLAVPPPAVLGPIRKVGVVPGSNQAYFWLLDGSLRAFGHAEDPILPVLANSSALQWERFQIAGAHATAIIGTLINGTESDHTHTRRARQRRSERPFSPLALLYGSHVSLSSVLLMQDAPPECALWYPATVLSILRAESGNASLHFTHLFTAARLSQCTNTCGALSDGRAVCFGQTFLSFAAVNSTVLTLDLPRWDGARSVAVQLTLNPLESTPAFTVCVLGWSGFPYCFTLQIGVPGVRRSYAPNQRLSSMIPDADTYIYGMLAVEEQLIQWNPMGIKFSGRVSTLPSLALQVAPQFHYRYRAGPVLPCPPGTFSLGVGSITPLCSGLCAAGRYGNSSKNINALCGGECPLGSFCPSGSIIPIPCPAGSYGAQTGLVNSGCSGSCLPGRHCPAGSSDPDLFLCPLGWASKQADEPCAPCEINTYSGLAPSSECTPCPPNSFAPTAGLSSCLACPSSGIECGLGSAMILEGHWAHLTNLSSSQFDASSFGPFVCPPDYCEGEGDGASDPVAGGALVNPCSPHRSLAGDNPLCGRCDAGYWEWNSVCTECPPVNWPIVLLLVALSFLLVMALHVLSQRSTSSARLSILIFFAQTALLLLRARSSDELSRVFAWLHLFNLSITAPTGDNCLGQYSAQQVLLLEAILPLTALLPMFVLAFIRWCWLRCSARRSTPRTAFAGSPPVSAAAYTAVHRPFPWHEYVRTTITILLIAYQQLCVCTLAYLQCVPVGPYRVVFSKPSIDCTSPDYKALQPLAIITIIFLAVIVPAALACFLYKHRAVILHQQHALIRAQIEQQDDEPLPPILKSSSRPQFVTDRSVSVSSFPEHSVMTDDSIFPGSAASGSGAGVVAPASSGLLTSSNILFTKRFSALYISYRPGCYMWLVVLLTRRVVLIMTAVLLLTSPQVQSLVFSLLCLLIAATHAHIQPFFVAIDNRLETMSLVCLLALSQVLASQSASSDQPMPLALQLIAGLLLSVPMLVLLTIIIRFATQRPRVRAMLRVCARQLPFCGRCCLPAPRRRHRTRKISSGGALSSASAAAADQRDRDLSADAVSLHSAGSFDPSARQQQRGPSPPAGQPSSAPSEQGDSSFSPASAGAASFGARIAATSDAEERAAQWKQALL